MKIGFIGCGNMGKAMIGGIIEREFITAKDVIVSDLNKKQLESMKSIYGIEVTTDNTEVAKHCDVIVLSIKPHLYPLIIEGIKDVIKRTTVIVTIAAGKALQETEMAFGFDVKVVRTMPNTPALVGEGMSALCKNNHVSDDEFENIKTMFECLGEVEVIEEKLFDAVTAVSGSSPAYVYMFIEALADGAVLQGMPREQAYKFASQAVLGSAKMVLTTKNHPAILKDQVCSPGGTTIEAVAKLEEKGMRDAVLSAVKTCAEKSKAMSK